MTSIKEHWQSYTSGLVSPQKYIDWAFYYMINCALQRRVWLSSDEFPCFPNMYVVFVAMPGVGKGLPIKAIGTFLRHWKVGDNRDLFAHANPEHKIISDTIIEQDNITAQDNELQGSSKGQEIQRPLLIPVAADATTYEALIQAVAESYRRINYVKFNEKLGKNTLPTYGHSSICFYLAELASLLRDRTKDLMTYLLDTYDCPEDYEYKTKQHGKDRVKRACLNILGAIQPDVLQDKFSDRLIGSGMSSRIFFIFASENRCEQFFIPNMVEAQTDSKKIILEHIRKLSTLYGRLGVDAETSRWLQDWWQDYKKKPEMWSNGSSKMLHYYSRKNLHVMKLAISRHFSYSYTMEISKDDFKWAIDFLHEEEKTMHYGLPIEDDNPQAKVSKRIMTCLGTGRKNFVELLIETHGLCDRKNLEETVDYLREIGQLRTESEEKNGKSTTYYVSRL